MSSDLSGRPADVSERGQIYEAPDVGRSRESAEAIRAGGPDERRLECRGTSSSSGDWGAERL